MFVDLSKLGDVRSENIKTWHYSLLLLRLHRRRKGISANFLPGQDIPYSRSTIQESDGTTRIEAKKKPRGCSKPNKPRIAGMLVLICRCLEYIDSKTRTERTQAKAVV